MDIDLYAEIKAHSLTEVIALVCAVLDEPSNDTEVFEMPETETLRPQVAA